MGRLLQGLVVTALVAVAPNPLAQTRAEDRTALEAAREALARVQDDASDEAAAWAEAYRERIALLDELLATARDREGLGTPEAQDGELAELTERLEAARGAEAPTTVELATAADVKRFEQAAKAARAEHLSAASAVEALDTRREEAEIELAQLPDRSTRAGERVEALAGGDEIAAYRTESARLEARVVSERATYLTAGLAVWERRAAMLEAELELARITATRAEALAALAREEASRLRELEAEAAREEADEEARRARLSRDPIERFRLRLRAEAASVRAEEKAFESELSELEQAALRAHEDLKDLKAEREALEHRLRLRPRGAETILRQHLEQCRRTARLLVGETLPRLERELDANQEALAVVLDRRWGLERPPSDNEELAALLVEVDPARRDEARTAFQAALEEDGLVAALRARAEQLEKAARLYASLLEDADRQRETLDDYEELILGRMLWTRSSPPVDLRALSNAWTELKSTPRPYREDRTWTRLRANIGSRFPVLFVGAMAIVALRFLTRRVARWRSLGDDLAVWRRRALRFAAAVAWAAGPSLQLWALAWTLSALGGPEAFNPPFTTLLVYQAIFVLARRLTRALLGLDGLFVGEHGLSPAIGQQLTRSTTVFTYSGQLFLAPYLVLAGAPFHFEVLPRLFFTGWLFGATVSVLVLLRRGGALMQAWTIEGGLLRPTIRALAVFATIILLPVLALDLMGYRVGVRHTMVNGLKIFTALFLLAGLFRAMERVGAYWVGRAATARDADDARLIEARGLGIRALVRIAAFVTVILAAVLLKDVLGIDGAFSKLTAEIRLVEVATEEWLTLWDVLVAIGWILGGHIIASNLRVLHESLVTPFASQSDEGSQYAYVTIVRYVLLAVAYGGALLRLGFSFQTIGWFATAASVGLGFGLQEIVANFVSGLILLFERPIRVGDIVTIGGTSGKIDSISMRATVITNWDRQTIIVPNKKFVTEDLTNWTRTDKVMRRQLIVRVAYGTKVDRVLALLDEIVRAHPAVLDDPPPSILFEAFGVVGVEFKVLFYTPIAKGLSTRSEIHAAISERFAAEGIEIPSVRLLEDGLGGPSPTP